MTLLAGAARFRAIFAIPHPLSHGIAKDPHVLGCIKNNPQFTALSRRRNPETDIVPDPKGLAGLHGENQHEKDSFP
jgi:hypothetical protein